VWVQVVRWVGIIAVLCAGWLIAQGVFRLTGGRHGGWEYLLTVLLTICIAGLVGGAVARLTGRLPQDPREVADEVVAALDRIAHGDFSVRVPASMEPAMRELAVSVNQMAQQLGDLEQQRQDFISNVSHEIQSPLTSIGGFAALLRRGGLDEATREHYLDVICAETARVSALGDNLLRLSALEDAVVPDKVEYRLDAQLRSVVLALEPQWSAKHQDVQLDVSGGEGGEAVCAVADEDMLRQVWTNLIQNAIKYTPEGGRITVRAAADGGDSAGACAGVPHRGVRVEVCDSGIGISAGDLPHVFERFFRADRSRTGAGNGLGLSLAHRIVELHGGTLSVTSEPGVGSTFTVRLP
jgi:signal transduction histidine kinase